MASNKASNTNMGQRIEHYAASQATSNVHILSQKLKDKLTSTSFLGKKIFSNSSLYPHIINNTSDSYVLHLTLNEWLTGIRNLWQEIIHCLSPSLTAAELV